MADDDFIPISPNPYIVGNPVRGRSMFFGREAEFQLIRKRFGDAEQGGLLVFCGERRSGKTSILFQILDRRLGPDFIPVLIDMQSMAVSGEAEFLARVSDAILSALGPAAPGPDAPDFSGDQSRAAVFARFVRHCLGAQPGRKLILLFDEYELFENKIDDGQLSEDVLNVLAALMESASVFIVFTGSQHLEQRRREYWSILGKSGFKTVSYLEREDAVRLIREPVAGRLHYDDGAVAAILRLTAGQPFYTQAVCQSLVDMLNDRRTASADAASVGEVVDALVDNPLPQMIFMWDGLERDDKLVLALLAECLEDGDAHAPVEALLRHLRQREYPLELDRARVATALEKLFKSELLLRDDSGGAPGYAFRMDLWRLWIRRQHSVWQVMREAGLAIRKVRRAPPWPALAAAVVALGVLAVVLAPRLLRRPAAPAALTGARGMLVLDVQPEDTDLRLDGRRVGRGAFRDAVAAGAAHRLELSATGYADTVLTATVAEGETLALRVALRELRGDLVVETVPPGADVHVDGRPAGRSPVTLRGLPVAAPHRVEASRAGYGVAAASVTLQAGTTVSRSLTLEMGKADVLVTTEPAGGEVRVDGATRGTAPVTVAALPLGTHVFRARLAGWIEAESTLTVTPATRVVHLPLAREAPGVLVVLGDVPAQIYVDGALVVENVQNSGPRTLPPGDHAVRVVLVSGESLDHTVSVRSGERATWDFSRNVVTRRPGGQ